MDFILGWDIGQAADPAAFLLLGRTPRGDMNSDSEAPDDYDFLVAMVHTLPLGTKYEDGVNYVEEFVTRPQVDGKIQIAVDRTGVGRPVVEMVRNRPSLAEITWGVTISSGKKESRDRQSPMDWSVPKKDLVGAFQLPLQRKRIRHARHTPGVALLVKQMLEFIYDAKGGTRPTFAAEGKAHDDAVLAACCAFWLSSIIPYQGDADVDTSEEAPDVLLPGLTPLDRPAPSWRKNLPRDLPPLLE